VFVDGKVVGEGASTLQLACGPHKVRIGSHGAEQTLVVPCGGAVELP
jgi:hypothetical protein